MAQSIIPADSNGIRDKAAIVGIGETEFSWNSGRSELQLGLRGHQGRLRRCRNRAAGHRRPGALRHGIQPRDIADAVAGHQEPAALGVRLLRRGRGQRHHRPRRRRHRRRIRQLRGMLPRRQPALRYAPGPGPRAGAHHRGRAGLRRAVGLHGAGPPPSGCSSAGICTSTGLPAGISDGWPSPCGNTHRATPALCAATPSPSTITRIPGWWLTLCMSSTSARRTTGLPPW